MLDYKRGGRRSLAEERLTKRNANMVTTVGREWESRWEVCIRCDENIYDETRSLWRLPFLIV